MAQQKFTVRIPDEFDFETRAAIGSDIVELIQRRTAQGKDKNNKNFPGYSEDYTESFDFKLAGKSKGDVNLSLSGEMMNALTLLENTTGSLTIGIPTGDTFNNDKAEGNIKGSYGGSPNPKKARDFMGISQSDLDTILQKYQSPSSALDVFTSLRAAAASTEIANSFLTVSPGGDDGL